MLFECFVYLQFYGVLCFESEEAGVGALLPSTSDEGPSFTQTLIEVGLPQRLTCASEMATVSLKTTHSTVSEQGGAVSEPL